MLWLLQQVKAALWEAISAFAVRPDFAALLWERLIQQGVLPSLVADPGLPAAVARYDMTYQLDEIEVTGIPQCVVGRCCDPPNMELLHAWQTTFQTMTLRLAAVAGKSGDVSGGAGVCATPDTLVRASGDALPDDGRAMSHFTSFVRESVLGQLGQRAFR